jgi:hypothetical protein
MPVSSSVLCRIESGVSNAPLGAAEIALPCGNSAAVARDDLEKAAGKVEATAHARNFLDCVRSRAKPNADLETIGHPSSLLCHIGNAAWRTGRTLRFDRATYTFKDDANANQFLTRAVYRKPWLLPKLTEV